MPRNAIVLLMLMLVGRSTPQRPRRTSRPLRVTLLSAGGAPLDDAFVQLRSRSYVIQSKFTDVSGVVWFVTSAGRCRVLVRRFGHAD